MSGSRGIAVSGRPIYDTIGAALLVLIHAVWLHRWIDPWTAVGSQTRVTIYAAGAAVVAIVASLTAVGIAAGGVGDRAKAVRRLYGHDLRRNWRALLMISALGATVCLAAMVAEGNHKAYSPYLFEFAIVWTVLRMARLTWLFDSLLALEDQDLVNPTGRAPKAPVSDDFKKRLGEAS